jgi:hypothetical protein
LDSTDDRYTIDDSRVLGSDFAVVVYLVARHGCANAETITIDGQCHKFWNVLDVDDGI